MSKHHHQSKAEQINSKASGAGSLRSGKAPYEASESKSESMQTKVAMDDNSIQLMAYQIHNEKGGTSLDNWLEAELIVKTGDTTVSNFINEGNPNLLQKA